MPKSKKQSSNTRKKRCNKFCDAYSKRNIMRTRKMIEQALGKKALKALTKKSTQKYKDLCKQAFCNPTCKGTLFEDGKNVPESLIKGKDKVVVQMLKRMRKEIFQGETSVLEDGFYKKFPNRKELEKQGAMSGCALKAMM